MKEFYFNRFEHRIPYQPIKESQIRIRLFQIAGVLTIITGFTYIYWRWASSLNFNAPWFSITLATAETISFVSIFFYVFDMWNSKDALIQAPPKMLSEIEALDGTEDRPIKIDVFIATYNEEAELLRYTIRDARAMRYSHPEAKIKFYVLDDGRRDGRNPESENIKKLCVEEGVNYITRESNAGFKAGNLKNGLEHSSGDVFVILDADTRPFPDFLNNTLGYFRNSKVAWVQTCQWFYDTTEAIPLGTYLAHMSGIKSNGMRKVLNALTFNIKTGEDIFGSDPRQFYQVIQRKRNNHNASFCCGAGSVHRREAVMSTALQCFSLSLRERLSKKNIHEPSRAPEKSKLEEVIKTTEITPFRFHASEDLYTSMILHSDVQNRWQSVMHPYVESKLLSPQDIDSFVKQRSRYAEGSIDIALHDNPLLKKGLSWQQKICYFTSVWSYFSCLWTLIFLLSPILFFFTHVMPVSCHTIDFLKYFLPFFIAIKFTEVAGSWGISQKRGKQYHICLFWLNLQALVKVISGKKIKFNVTPKSKQKTKPFKYAWPHIVLVLLTLTGLMINLPEAINGDSNFQIAAIVNGVWGLINCHILGVYIRAAYWDTEKLSSVEQSHNKYGSWAFVSFQKLIVKTQSVFAKIKSA